MESQVADIAGAKRGRSGNPSSPWGFFGRPSAILTVFLGLLLIGVIAVVDYSLGPRLSLAIFYLIPIAIGAWWGGFAFGILFSLISTVVWHALNLRHDPGTELHVCLWNDVVRFGFFVITSSLLARVRLAVLREQTLARTDPLTGAANGRTFYEQTHRELCRSSRTLRPFTLAYLDLDHFKEVNDRSGHLAGDEVLKRVARTMHENLRSIDLLARLGGDEFALLLPETDAAGAIATLTRLRELLLHDAARHGWPISYSIGAATFLKAPGDVHLMIQHVDALMYRVKRSGKNRIEHEVVQDPDRLRANSSNHFERRATMRIQCNHIVRVSTEDRADVQTCFARILNISSVGIGLRLSRRLPQHALVTVEPLCTSKVRTLLARVVRTLPDANDWFHGCELSNRLNDEELCDWVVGASMVTSLEEQPCA
jgi:diguanylate cyclase (GGDEF)-like protein